MGLVTVFWPLATTGSGETVVQNAGETRFVVDCKLNPAALVGNVSVSWRSTAHYSYGAASRKNWSRGGDKVGVRTRRGGKVGERVGDGGRGL